jgi:arsenate reductase (thioredoxin)
LKRRILGYFAVSWDNGYRKLGSKDFKTVQEAEMKEKKRVLFLCTGNSCRSQIAEAWTRRLRNDEYEAYSAGIEPKGIDPLAVHVMSEAGIDISSQRSKSIESLGDIEFDYVVTLCDNARESCPYYPAKTAVIHKGFDDPPALAKGTKNNKNAIRIYRRVRDEIKDYIMSL